MHLSEIAARVPDKAAVVMADGSASLTYAELDRRSLQVAAIARELGLGVGDHAAVLMANRPEFLEVAWGLQRSGIYWTPVNWHLTAREAGYVLADCGARVLFACAATSQLAAGIASGSPGLTTLVAGAPPADPGSYDAVRDAAVPTRPAAETEGIHFFYSSGTTGMPKGITPNHAFPPFGTGLKFDHVLAASFGLGPDSVYLCPAPLYHAAPIGWSIATQRQGGTVVVLERFDALECLRAIEKHRVTHAQFVPTHFVRMLKLPEEQRRQFDLSSLQVVVHAAAPCPVDVKRAIIDWFGPKVLEFYAGSESTGMTMITAADWLTHPGSVGRAIVGSVRIVGEGGEELPTGQTGTVYFADAGTFSYHNDPERTAAAFNDQGWSTLGDLGHLDDEGYLYLDDRRTDLIITGGVNVYPREIEDVLLAHPGVLDVAVIGVPDAEMGQSVRAVVQPIGVAPPGLAEELYGHCQASLASFKCPRTIVFTDDLPRLPTGKLLRRVVRDRHS